MDKKKIVLISNIIIFIGIIILYIIYSNAKIPFTDPENINDTLISKTIKSEIVVSSVKLYNSSFTIYPKEYHFSLVGFEKLNENIKENDFVSFEGKVINGEFGIVVYLDSLKIRKAFK